METKIYACLKYYMYIYPENVKLIVVNLKEDVVKIFFLP